MQGGAVTEREWEALYFSHWNPMVRLALLLVDDVGSAEDVAQDAFIALHHRYRSLRDDAAAVAYLRTCVINGSRSMLRKRRVARRHAAIDRIEPDNASDHQLLLAERSRDVMTAVRALPRRQREVLVLRYWEHLNEAEIAAALGVSRGTVKSTASRALDSLETTLGAAR